MKYFIKKSMTDAMARGKEFSAVAQLFIFEDDARLPKSMAGDPLVEVEVTIKEQRKEESGT